MSRSPAETAASTVPLLAACYLALLEAAGSPDVITREGPNVVAGRTPVDLGDFNRIMVRTVTAELSEAEIDALLAELGDAPALSCWLPAGAVRDVLEARFVSRGFAGHEGAGVPAMWLETAGLAAQPLPSGVTIERVVSAEGSDLMTRVAVDGFGVLRPFEPPMADFFRPLATKPESPVHLFLARLDGRAVATALGAVSGEAVGIYNVATLPGARGRGIGGAVTLAAVLDGRDRGARLAVLESSRMGFPVYQRLGFAEAGRYRVLTRSIGD